MANPTTSMTTSEFAKATGIPAATVSKLIRDGRLRAKKQGKCWMIAPSQLEAKAVRELAKAATPVKGKKAPKPALSSKAAKPAKVATARTAAPAQPAAAPVPAGPKPEPVAAPQPVSPAAGKTFTVAEFAAMTYLTENGVAEWIKTGRLKGRQEAGGQWVVFESNLQVPDISRLLRK
jgi:excisionase family DNA binding protein